MGKQIVCAGNISVDISASATKPLNLRGKNPGAEVMVNPGGVAENAAEVLARIGHDVTLIAAAGVGGFDDIAVNGCRESGVHTDHIRRIEGEQMVVCIIINDEKGDLVVMAANPNTPNCYVTIEQVKAADELIKNCTVMFVCPTMPMETIQYIVDTYPQIAKMADVGSVSSVPRTCQYLKHLHTVKVNDREAAAMADHPVDTDENIKIAAKKILDKGMQNVVITLGERGAVYANRDFYKFYPIKPVESVKNTSGAGDSFFAGLMHGYAEGLSIDDTMEFAAACARLTIQSRRTISPDITMEAALTEVAR